MLKFELYKLWLGFIEKLILSILAAVIILLVIGKVFIPVVIGFIWFSMIVVLTIFYVYLSLKLRKLCDRQVEEEEVDRI